MRSRNVSTEFSFLASPYLGISVWSPLEPGRIVTAIMIPRMTANIVVVPKYAIVRSPILPHVLASSPAIPPIKLATTNGMISILSMRINISPGNCKYMISLFVNCPVARIPNPIAHPKTTDSKRRTRIRFCFNPFTHRCNILVPCLCWYEPSFSYRTWVSYFADVSLLQRSLDSGSTAGFGGL